MTELSDYKRIVSGPQIAGLEATIRNRDSRITELEQALAEAREIIQDLARSPLRDSNGGRNNFAAQGHDLANLVIRARLFVTHPDTRDMKEET